jgi:ribosomal protein L33
LLCFEKKQRNKIDARHIPSSTTLPTPSHALHRTFLPTCLLRLALRCVALRCITLRCSACSLPYLTSPSVPTYLPTLLTHPLLFPIPSHLVASAPTPHVPSRHVTKRARHKTAASLRLASPRSAIPPLTPRLSPRLANDISTLPRLETKKYCLLQLSPHRLANKPSSHPTWPFAPLAPTHAPTHAPAKHALPSFLSQKKA